MNSKEVIVVATGLNKSIALKQCVEGPITSMYTCSVIQNHNKAIVICDEPATSELLVKTVNYYKSLQKNINLEGKPIIDIIESNINNTDRILIVSPHPDDDVIGMGGTMQLLPNKKNVKIIYMTNGDGGLGEEKKGIRIKEALSSIKVLGYERKIS